MGDIELQTFADRLKELRTSLDLTQAQFVNGLGITASALSAYEKNLKNPSISVAKRIAEKYHVSIDWLCGLSDKKTNDSEPQTYADIIDLLVTLEDVFQFEIVMLEDGQIEISDDIVRAFMSEWVQMVKLYRNGTIDHKLYTLWLDDKKEKYDVELFNHDDIASFLDQLAYDKS